MNLITNNNKQSFHPIFFVAQISTSKEIIVAPRPAVNMLHISRVFIVSVFLLLVINVHSQEFSNYMRKLIGSNCILIVRGSIPPYYDCVGCIIEEASACVDDMRTNKSYNVAHDCKLNTVKEYYDHTCCPSMGQTSTGRTDLRYLGSAYPETLRCVAAQGCGSSIIYQQLLSECLASCPFTDPRNGNSVCYSDFNSASTVRYSTMWTLISVAVVSAYFILSVL